MTSPDQQVDRRDKGGAGIETTFAVTALLLVLFFVVGGLRVVNTNGDVASAARSAARAAATARTAGDSVTAAQTVAANILSNRGVACDGGPSVSVSGGGTPGSVVNVTVTCVVSLNDVVVVGFPGSRTVTVSAVEYVDAVRS